MNIKRISIPQGLGLPILIVAAAITGFTVIAAIFLYPAHAALWIACCALSGAGLGSLGRFGWPAEPIANLTPQLFVASLIALIVSIAQGFLISIILAAMAAVWLGVRMARIPQAAPQNLGAGAALTVVWFNAWKKPKALARCAAWAHSVKADVIAIAETPETGADELAALFPEHPYVLDSDKAPLGENAHPTRVVLMSRWPLATSHISDTGSPGRPILSARISVDDIGDIVVIAAHPFPPATPGYLRQRDRQIEAVSELASQHRRFVVMGDFNLSPTAPAYHRLPGRRAGAPMLQPTWLIPIPGLGLTIDHIMVDDDARSSELVRSPFLGSDHYAITADVFWRD